MTTKALQPPPQPQPASGPSPTGSASTAHGPFPVAPTPKAARTYWGDRLTFSVWLACAVLLAFMLFGDLLVSLFRLVF